MKKRPRRSLKVSRETLGRLDAPDLAQAAAAAEADRGTTDSPAVITYKFTCTTIDPDGRLNGG